MTLLKKETRTERLRKLAGRCEVFHRTGFVLFIM